MKPAGIDAIVVLGGSLQKDGSLPRQVRARVEEAVALHKKCEAPIIFSGKWSFLRRNPPTITEAKAMAEFAISLGVDPACTLLEEESKDTLGNAYFTKAKYLAPLSWRRIAVVTSEDHAERSAFLFNKVLGPNYSVEIQPAMNPPLPGTERLRAAKEQRGLALSKRLLRAIPDGDSEAVYRFLITRHPGYGGRLGRMERQD